MKAFLLLIFAFTLSLSSFAQTDTATTKVNKLFVITKNDGTQFTGYILQQDAREVLIETQNLGKIFIPKHEIKEIREVHAGEMKDGEFIHEDFFATRYFITTNGLPIQKNESYVLWNLWGPDFQFGVGKNFGMGIMTTWLGVPLIANAKYSFPLSKKLNFAVGALVGTGSWAAAKAGLALPFASFTFGGRNSNVTLSAGYGAVWGDGPGTGRALLSVAGMKRVGKKVTILLDSFIVPPGTSYYVSSSTGGVIANRRFGFALITPGIRLHTGLNKAIQFGFMGVVTDNGSAPIPIPMVQWFRKL